MAYIDRDKAIAYVEEQYRLFKDDEGKQSIVEGCVEALKFTPTADVVEVVRCKDCKLYGIDRVEGGFCMRTFSPSMWRNETGELKPTDYCSYGERRNT